MDIGSRIGPYEILSPIGAGGMGEVYRARDSRLGRDVAIKVLPRAFSEDPDRRARFEREARVLAALNHPHIAAIHGFEEAAGVGALVLELVEGPTLADRLRQGAVPVGEAIAIARQIAAGLESAHEKGIIHRDLKPANIKLTAGDGAVKLLDFGLAKALEPRADGDPSQSPTLTSAGTRVGMILGTAAYMSPEQA
ncbi:MAG TPA: serine/threonine-protein kinase, partial [Vicinamibacterales bacterium]|nr:serine/threonine-protein kinase [Vicinamibacterales bacterium]